LPIFDDKTDSFTSGHLPKSADNFFNNSDRMKEFFTIKPKGESLHGEHH